MMNNEKKKTHLSKIRIFKDTYLNGKRLLNTFFTRLGAMRNHHKVIAFFVLVMLIGGGFFLFSPEKVALASWWNDGWSYRKELAITNSSTAQTNTQVKIISGADLSALVAAGKLQADLDDLRFTDLNGNVVEYWIEDSTNTSVDIWGLLPSVPSSGTKVYMYYGNNNASEGQSVVGTLDHPAASCEDILLSGITDDGVYYIDPSLQEIDDAYQVYCDMTTDGGGWTLVYKYVGTGSYSPGQVLAGSSAKNNVLAPLDSERDDGRNANAYNDFWTADGIDWLSYFKKYDNTDTITDTKWYVSELESTVDWGTDVYYKERTIGCSAMPGSITVRKSDGTNYGSSSYRYVASTDGRGYLAAEGGIYSDTCGQTSDNTLSELESELGHFWYSNSSGGGSTNKNKDRCTWICWANVDDYSDSEGYSGREWYAKGSKPVSLNLSAGSLAAEEQGPGLVASWSFDEGYGTTTYDDAAVGGYVHKATGGTITEADGYRIHTFTSSGTFTPTTSGNVEVLVVGGGGGGGSSAAAGGGGGGAGAGGLVYNATYKMASSPITVTVGSGGVAGVAGANGLGSNGSNSVFGSITAIGGGGGPPQRGTGVAGGSGSGGGYNGYTTVKYGGSGEPGQGHAGGDTTTLPSASGAGGGGAGGVGGDNLINHAGGDGGVGLAYDISGSSVTYAAGGRGGGGTSPVSSPANTGKGGDGSYSTGTAYAGGSGVVIVRYPINNDGSIAGATWQTEDQCVSGKCLYFDGTNDYVNAGDSSSISLHDQPMTISTWIKPQNRAYSSIFNKTDDSTTWDGYVLSLSASGRAQFSLFKTYGSVYIDAYSTTILPLNEWSHIEAVYTNTQVLIYINGELDSSTSYSGGFDDVVKAGNNAIIGRHPLSAVYYFKGFLDELRIYPYARTAEQVKKDYHAGLSGMKGGSEGVGTTMGGTSKKWMSDGLVGYWKMDEASGDILDASGNGYTGTTTGTTVESGKYGNGRSFNGTTDYSDLGDIDMVTGKTLTASAWIKTTGQIDQYEQIIGKNYNGWSWALQGDNTTNKVRFFVSANSYDDKAVSNSTLNDGVWHHVIGVYDGNLPSSNIKMYIDGVLQSTTADNTIDIPNTIDHESIGAGVGAASQGLYFPGSIDEVRVYNRALSPREVRDLYEFAPGPVGHWKMDENTGTVANDISGNGNTGTITGATWTNGKYGRGLNFSSGSDTKVRGTLSLAIPAGGDYTQEAWIYPTSAVSGVIIDDYNNAEHYMSYNSSGTIKVNYYDNPGTPTHVYALTTQTVPLNQWAHVVGVVDSGNYIKIYINGVLSATNSSLSIETKVLDDFVVGQFGGGIGKFNGKIDEVKIYDYARTQKQIIEDMNAGKPAIKSPIAHWKFDEGQRGVAHDSSGHNNHGVFFPDYTNDLTGNGTATASSTYRTPGAYEPGNVFDDNGSTIWDGCCSGYPTNQWLKYDFGVGNEKVINRYTYTDQGGECPVDWTFEGSNNDSDWTVLDSQNFTAACQGNFTSPIFSNGVNNTAYRYYRWYFTEGYGANSNGYRLTEAELMETDATSAWTDSGKVGKALSFDGSNDYVAVPTNNSIDTNNVSLSAWINSTNINKRYAVIAAKNYQYNIQLYDTTGRVAFYVKNASGTLYSAVTDTALSNNTWYHIVGTFDGNNLKIYVDGVLLKTQVFSGTVISNDYDFLIGQQANNCTPSPSCVGGNYYFAGKIDEVKIFNYALTADEVLTDYNQGKTTVLGGTGTESDGITPSTSTSREYCVPGDTATCNPPVAEWKFDEKAGTSANDSSGNGNTGTLTNGPTWTNGKYGSAVDFDGVDDYIEMEVDDSLKNGTFTVEAWINGKSWDSDRNDFVSWANTGFHMAVVNNGTLRWWNYLGGGWKLIDDPATLSLNRWYHVSGTWDGTTMKLYKDGRLVNSTAAHAGLSSPTYANSVPRIGAYSLTDGSGANSPVDGKIDQVKIYDYARTSAQIAWDYNHGKPVGHWRFDECQGGTAHDESGNGNDGTITIGATGTQTVIGTCTDDLAASAWNNGQNGKINSAMSFDGTDDYVDVGNDASLNISGDFAVAAWIKMNDASDYKTIVSWGEHVSYLDRTLWIEQGTGKAALYFYPTSTNQIIGTSDLRDNNWHFVVGTLNGTTGKIFVDGNLENSGTVTANNFTYSGTMIGKSMGDNYRFQGLLDDVQIFNYALTPLQIKNAYNAGAINFK